MYVMQIKEMKPSTAYRMTGYTLDANGRAKWTYYEVPLIQTSPMSSMSAKQVGQTWGLGFSQNSPKPYNLNEMHKTNRMGIVWVMSGHLETTIQDGEMRRRAPGEGNFVHGDCLHHSTMRSTVPSTTLSLNLTSTVTKDYVFN
jgi:hypothetical protein|tara:strand:- start:2371 stop:2799 length:429 start_codon:yes stop_codon:yes gene_type:complete